MSSVLLLLQFKTKSPFFRNHLLFNGFAKWLFGFSLTIFMTAAVRIELQKLVWTTFEALSQSLEAH